MDVDGALNQAIREAKAGRKEEARLLLEAVLDADERNERAWLWLSGVVDSDAERVVCLENVLAINPENQVAAKGLAALRAAAAAGQPALEATSQESAPGAPPGTAAKRQAAVDSRMFIAITIGLVLMLVCVVVSIVAVVILSPFG